MQALMHMLGSGGYGQFGNGGQWMRTANRHPQTPGAYAGPVGVEGALPGGNSRFAGSPSAYVSQPASSITQSAYAGGGGGGYSALLSWLRGR